MKLLKKLVGTLVVAGLIPVLAHGQELSAVETAELGVETLLQTVTESKDFFLSDRERYFSEIESVLTSFVDFEAVATVVMSRYANSQKVDLSRDFREQNVTFLL